MASIVDPAADTLWESLGSTMTVHGTEDREPRTTQDWPRIRDSAITLVESANLLMIQPRRIVPMNGTLADEGSEGVLHAAEAQQLLDTQRPAFVQLAHALHDVSERNAQCHRCERSKCDLESWNNAGRSLRGLPHHVLVSATGVALTAIERDRYGAVNVDTVRMGDAFKAY
ncbi:MAG TPA: hypothetical protein VK629_01060 [Steroidobacteraceae bacterium]|nr:hypothetical protein [Steroidobacteraceae bacterium]